jgi:hypothetical protein
MIQITIQFTIEYHRRKKDEEDVRRVKPVEEQKGQVERGVCGCSRGGEWKQWK